MQGESVTRTTHARRAATLLAGLLLAALIPIRPAGADEPATQPAPAASQPPIWQPYVKCKPAAGAGRWHFAKWGGQWLIREDGWSVGFDSPRRRRGEISCLISVSERNAHLTGNPLAEFCPIELVRYKLSTDDHPGIRVLERSGEKYIVARVIPEIAYCLPCFRDSQSRWWVGGCPNAYLIDAKGNVALVAERCATPFLRQMPMGQIWIDGVRPANDPPIRPEIHYHGGGNENLSLDEFAIPIGCSVVSLGMDNVVYHRPAGQWVPMNNCVDPYPCTGTVSMVCGQRMLMTTRTAVWEFDQEKVRWIALGPSNFKAVFDRVGRRVLYSDSMLAVLDGDPFETGKQFIADDEKLWAENFPLLDARDFKTRQAASDRLKQAYPRLVLNFCTALAHPDDLEPEQLMRLREIMAEITPPRERGELKIANLLTRMHPDYEKKVATSQGD